MFKKNGIRLRVNQVWTIGKRTKSLMFNNHGYEIGDSVVVKDLFRGDSLILVHDNKSGVSFDVKLVNLGKLVVE